MASVTLRNVTRRWGDFVGVDEVSIDIRDGEFLVLLGPSGCGKTTTMRMVAGLEEPTGGDILIGGRRVNGVEPKERDVAMVFQSYALYPQMSVYENIRFPLKVRGIPSAEHDARVRRAAAMVELGPLLERKPKALSGGQRQRVALARAIVRQPQVFLMDEPLSNLDAKLRVSTRAQLKHLHHEIGVTTIYVTHDQIEAMTLADRVVVMNRGAVQQVATPEAIYNDPETLFVAGFVGSPAMNLVLGEVADGTFRAQDIALPSPAPHRGAAVLGVRPEDLTLVEPGTGAVNAPVYSVELTGEATLVTVKIGDALVSARAGKDFRAPIGTPVGFAAAPGRAALFDAASEKRIRSVH